MNLNIIRPLRSLFWRLVDNSAPDESKSAPAGASATAGAVATDSQPEPAAPRNNGGYHNGRGIELPLQSILAGLPLELQARVTNTDAGALTIIIPLEKILSQLSRGVVQISFGELRQAAPDFFTMENDRDRVMVALPLGEILSRLNPALITCRRVQRQVEVPEDIASPFDARNQGGILSIGPAKPPSASPTDGLPPGRQVAPAAAAPFVPPARANITFAPTPAPPATQPPVSAPQAPPLLKLKEPAQAPTAPPVVRAAAPNDPNFLSVSVYSLAEAWPESVRRELLQLNLTEAKVVLPAESVERGLKQGRVAFTWKTLRSWLKPAPRPGLSAHDATVLELPLKIVAPLFLARQNDASKTRKKVAIDPAIPNLFSGFPPPAGGAQSAPAAAPAPPKQEDTNFYVWDDSSETVRLEGDAGKQGPSPGTKFVAKYATPNEVVSRAAGLEGVAGALIALPDGLMVASRLGPDVNGDTLAAFLPQIFSKISQCTRELRMGELNNVNFTVGNIPWKIFRVNAIFFAAFGRAGEPLPTAQLAALAAELDHKAR
ncbi:MAG TPA: roadblock/LC7 domain-containing protein [Verrucomicrobiota bacterium]|nr:roadblock/LC7 domain-containing protein [Verrucomicrobiota bacterium]